MSGVKEVLVALECHFSDHSPVRIRVTPAERAEGDEESAFLRGCKRFFIDVGWASGPTLEGYENGGFELWRVEDKYGFGHCVSVRRVCGFARSRARGVRSKV